jgi:hypothetical protein
MPVNNPKNKYIQNTEKVFDRNNNALYSKLCPVYQTEKIKRKYSGLNSTIYSANLMYS